MKNLILLIISFCLYSFSGYTQEYKIAMSSGKLIIDQVNNVSIEGYNGNEIIISTGTKDNEKNERAMGLKVINAEGLTDNTGIGLSVSKEGSEASVSQVSQRGGRKYTFKVPSGVSVLYESSSMHGGKLHVVDMAGEIEVSANYNSIDLKNVTGPMAIHTVYGSIDADFASVSQSNSISLYSVYSHVDVTIPGNSKATFQLSTNYGDMYTDLDLKFEGEDDEMKKISSKKMFGKLNGGGVDFSVKSGYSSIYLRKK